MPILGVEHHRPAIERMHAAALDRGVDVFDHIHIVDENKIRQIAREHHLSYLGHGIEVFALHAEISGKPVVIAVNHDNLIPSEAKRLFYLQRFLKTLFPHNFPSLYFASGVASFLPNLTGTIRQPIGGKSPFRWPFTSTAKHLNNLDKNSPYPIQPVIQTIQSLDLPIKAIDTNHQNFVVSQDDGGVYYVDLLDITAPNWPEAKINQYLADNHYSPEQIRQANLYLSRVKALSSRIAFFPKTY